MSNIGDCLPLDLSQSTDHIGEQLGRAIAPMIEDAADALYALAKGFPLSHMSESKAIDALLKVYLRESKRKTRERKV